MRTDVRFRTPDGTTLSGWLYVPDGVSGPVPAVVMAHGFSALKEMGLDAYARVFEAAGLAVLAYDHRNFGASEGEPRFEIDPWAQMHDMRHAISYLRTLPQVDPGRIGVWGASYSGGHALAVAGLDKRVRCAVAIVPLISGYETTLRGVPAAQMAQHLKPFHEERDRLARGQERAYMPVTSSGETADWIFGAAKGTTWENKVSVLSQDLFMEYEPGAFAAWIAPTPLLMIVGDRDTRCLTDLQLATFNRLSEPKRLLLVEGGHYSCYTERFPEASSASRDWFVEHLLTAGHAIQDGRHVRDAG